MNKGGNQSNSNDPSNGKNEGLAGSWRWSVFQAGDGHEVGGGDWQNLLFSGFLSGGSSGKWFTGGEGLGGRAFFHPSPPDPK